MAHNVTDDRGVRSTPHASGPETAHVFELARRLLFTGVPTVEGKTNMQRTIQLFLISILLGSTFGGCVSSRERSLLDAQDALERCDMREANAHFEAAYEEDMSDPDGALGFALTELALLPEEPAFEAALADLGFTGPLDMQTLVFGSEGVLARSARGDTCDSIDEFARANLPYPALQEGGPDATSLFRAGLTVEDMMQHGIDLQPTLERIAVALETAAGGVTEPVTIDGGCGIGTVTLQQPELLAAAALLHGIHAAISAMDAYRWDIEFALLIESTGREQEFADAMNRNFMHLETAAPLVAAKNRIQRAAEIAERALGAAGSIDAPVENGLFDWSSFDRQLIADLSSLLSAGSMALDGETVIPLFEPELRVDASTFITDPLDMASAPGPLFVVSDDPQLRFVEVQMDGEVLEAMLAPRFAPGFFEMDITFTAEERWESVDLEPVFEPAQRYQDVWMCIGGSATTGTGSSTTSGGA